MSKLFNTVVFGLGLLLLTSSYKVYADDSTIYQCTALDGSISFQDTICEPAKNQKLIQLAMHKNADAEQDGLREHEMKVLEQILKRLEQERELQNNIHVAKINRSAQQPVMHHTSVHVHHNPTTAIPNINQNLTQNSLVITR